MASLSPAQIDFLRNHLGYDTAGFFKKKQMKSQIQEFWRRREKAQQDVNDLPPDHPQLAALKTQIENATKKAEGGDLKGAYNDLNATKSQARTAATAVRGGVSVAAIEADLNVLETTIRRLLFEQGQIRDDADDKSQTLLDRANRMPDPSGALSHEEIVQRAGENLKTKQRSRWTGTGCRTQPRNRSKPTRHFWATCPLYPIKSRRLRIPSRFSTASVPRPTKWRTMRGS